MKFLDEYKRILVEQVLLPIGEKYRCRGPSNTPLSVCVPIAGSSYTHDLMVVGRAVNGWEYAVPFTEFRNERSADQLAHCSIQFSMEADGCPMASWVEEPTIGRRSSFWRVIRRVANGLRQAAPETEGWSSTIVWTNLYKIAPAKGGNPSEGLASIQELGCRILLRMEIEHFNPRRILYITDIGWARPFVDINEPKLDVGIGKYVQRVSHAPNGRICIVAARSERKPELDWSSEVLSAFRNAELACG